MSFYKSLGLSYPLIQAPMLGIQGSAMAIACSEAGALGSLPCAMLNAEKLEEELVTIKGATSKPVNVNFFVHEDPAPNASRDVKWRETLAPYFNEVGLNSAEVKAGPGRAPFSSDMADVLEKFKPEVVSFHFGLPSSELLQRVRSWGARILSSATTVEEAVFLADQSVDAVIAQGLEAGGHRGHFLSDDITKQLGVFSLLPQIKQAIDLPVIAAGGIASPKEVKAMLELGADMVQVGTSYMLCDEANTISLHREALKSSDAQHTALTNLFSGRPARGIVNRLMRELGPMSELPPEFPLAGGLIGPLKAAAEKQGIHDFSSLWAGQNTTGCKEVSAVDMTKWLVSEI